MNELPLRDIHLPEAVSWWPPAIGWWLLALLLVVIVLAYFLIRFLRQRASATNYKKMALQAFQQIRKNEQQDPMLLLREISQLLRRIALSYLPRQQVASLTGQQWIEQLNQLSATEVFSQQDAELISQASYRPQVSYSRDELLERCEQWIRQLPDQPRQSRVKS